MSSCAVRIMEALSSFVVLVQGIWKLAEEEPSHNIWKEILKECKRET